jgi:hypothetical protein
MGGHDVFTRLKGFVFLLSGFIFIAVLASEADGCICGGTNGGKHILACCIAAQT